jgi:hypothetical protein
LWNISIRLQEGLLASLESLKFYISTKPDGKRGYNDNKKCIERSKELSK